MSSRLNPMESRMRARPRLFISIMVGVAVGWLVPHSVAEHAVARGLIGWNVAAVLYLVLAVTMMVRSSHDHMRQRALLQDMRPWVVLGLVVVAALVSLVAIVLELAVAKEMHGAIKGIHMSLAAMTILTSWAFTHTMFALHYAHDFYAARAHRRPGGVIFPGTDQPDYLDFMYLSGVIGTSAQTADVSFSSSSMRRTGLVHCVLSFAFNTIVLALTVNIAASMF
ncbi:MAG: DUF1345 domain-containing protein [Pseudomonadota bacterium]